MLLYGRGERKRQGSGAAEGWHELAAWCAKSSCADDAEGDDGTDENSARVL